MKRVEVLNYPLKEVRVADHAPYHRLKSIGPKGLNITVNPDRPEENVYALGRYVSLVISRTDDTRLLEIADVLESEATIRFALDLPSGKRKYAKAREVELDMCYPLGEEIAKYWVKKCSSARAQDEVRNLAKDFAKALRCSIGEVYRTGSIRKETIIDLTNTMEKYSERLYDASLRSSGRTTRLVNQFVEEILSNPNVPVAIFDHVEYASQVKRVRNIVMSRLRNEHGISTGPSYDNGTYLRSSTGNEGGKVTWYLTLVTK